MWDDIKNNPLRIYNVLIASLALLIYYVPTLPEPLIFGLVAALCGVGGEVVRGNVTPVRKVDDAIKDALWAHEITKSSVNVVSAPLAEAVKPTVDVTDVDTSPSIRVIP